MADLDPLRLPLHGRRLIEASAGTGKTHAIGSLLLRTLLGHGDDASAGGPVRLDRVLIVTFTRAATMELRDRVRRRIREAREAFEDAARYRAGARPDPFLCGLLDETADHERAERLLGAALGQLDEAAVFTIHGFCQRILAEAAFESGAVFEQDYVEDDSDYQSRAARDFWRREILPLDAETSALVREQWADPDALLKSVRSYLGRSDLRVRGDSGLLDEPIEARLEVLRDGLLAVKRHWREAGVREEIEGSRISRDKRGPGGPSQLDAVAGWVATDECLLTRLDDDGARISVLPLLTGYRREALLAKLNQKGRDPDLDDWFDRLEPVLADAARLLALVRARALDWIRTRIEAEKRADRMIAPDDVLRQTARALAGPLGRRFAAEVRSRYPVAFIDEFQDTDPLQYGIFDALYPHAPREAVGALVMIGDPKQAIYAFRGADVFAYLQARAALPAGARVSMGVNWRSSPEMLTALQTLYDAAEDGFATDEIRFHPVDPRPDAPRGAWTRGGSVAPALTFWHLPRPADGKRWARGRSQAVLAEAAAARVAGLLDGSSRIGERVLQQADVALLVRGHREALLMRDALAARGIASVRQGRESVFGTAEARDLGVILQAALDPRDERAVRSALATGLLGLPLTELWRETLGDEARWQMHLDRFARYQGSWRNGGVMVMLRALLADYDLPARLLAGGWGARRLTDLRHLGELLQARAAEFGSMHRLQRWFARRLADPGDDEAARMRLESDSDLVRIVTVHAAKGLEYEVVVLPFGLAPGRTDDALFHERDADGWHAVLDLLPDAAATEAAEQEQLAEDLRLLYVALTRARTACFVAVADIAGGRSAAAAPDLDRSALGHLLFGRTADEVDDARIDAALTALAGRSEAIGVERLEPEQAASAAAPLDAVRVAVRREFAGHIERDWQLTSYSALVASEPDDSPLRPGAQDEGHPTAEPEPEQAPEPAEPDAAARFPRGARPGSCLHELLERWPAAADEVGPHVRRILRRWGLDEAAGVDPEQVCRWLERVRSTPLPLGASLADAHVSMAEMEFHLPVDGLDTAGLTTLLGRYGYVDEPLARPSVRGLLRGFVDLVIEHDGRFWILDYKSNWLGASPAAYRAEALAASIREHRYDLQFLLYSVALRRLLRARLGTDDVDDRFGGVLYLYLRGMDGHGTTGIHHERPAPALLDAIDALLQGETA